MKFHIFILLPLLFSICLCEVDEDKKLKLLSDFMTYYNLQPTVLHEGVDESLLDIRKIDPVTYHVDVTFTVNDGSGARNNNCSATIKELNGGGISIVDHDIKCTDQPRVEASGESSSEVDPVTFTSEGQTENVVQAQKGSDPAPGENSGESSEVNIDRTPIRLENEVQADTAVTSGEQFIAIPRNQSSAPCIGCSSHVSPEAKGARDLADLGVRHLDIHEPTVNHSLDSIIDIERQVQVVNGVRYILTLSINFSNCTDSITEFCTSNKICKITILVKPWQTLPSGAKYRAILANNCTEEWLFGDNGEVLPESTDEADLDKNVQNPIVDNDEVRPIIQKDLQSQSTLTEDRLKALEDQILPSDHVRVSEIDLDTSSPEGVDTNKDHIVKDTSTQRYSDNSLPLTESTKHGTSNLSQDKRNAIDKMLDFFHFSEISPKVESQTQEVVPRVKRSQDSHTDDFHSSLAPGGETSENPNDEKFLQLANESLQKYLSDSNNGQPLKVDHIVKVSTQVVAGIITRITFVATPASNADGNIISCFSKIWEQPWINQKDIEVSCESDNSRVKRQVRIGGQSVKDPNKPEYLQLAQESLQKYLGDHGNRQPHRVVRVDRVTTQVVSGSLTEINFVATPTDNGNSFNCFSKIWEQMWLNKKEINVTCDDGNHKARRELFGGETTQNPNDSKYLQLAQESLQKYLSDHGNRQPHRVLRVERVTTQVVSGSLTKINFVATPTDNGNSFNCFSTIWEQMWLNKKEINVTCDDGNHKARRELFGGETTQNPNDSKYLQLAQESLQKYLSDHGNRQPHRVVRVDRVTTQVVSGSLTKINFVATPTDNGNSFNCFSTIWEQMWLNKKEINVTCDDGNHKARRELFGGETTQNPNDSKYLQLAQESLQKYLSDHGNRQPHRVVRVDRVTTQVVSGSLTKINFVATPTDNRNSFNCFSTIWEQMWLNRKEINVTCDDGNHKARRELFGGETTQNPNDSKYLQLAQESLQKYLSDHGNRQPHRIVRVERVTTQVVSGSLTKINFVATPSDNGNSFNCFSTIWEQAWLNKKEINVTCDDGNHRARRGLVGGETSQNPNDSKYLQLAQESLQKYLSDHGDRQPHRIVRVERVTTQVVSGSLTKINFVATPTDNGNSFNCFSTIWEQVWLNKKDINVTCDDGNHRARRGLAGGETSQNPNDSKYLQLAQESLQKYLSDHGNRQPHRIVRVERVTTQVVSGSLTKINFVATPSDNGNSFNCFSTIWEQVWLNKKEINVTCDDGNHRARRGLVGGETSQNPNDSKYLQLAQESLQKYLSDHGKRQPHRIVRVERVTTQVVSGSLTKINFVATPSDNGNSFNCFSTIWEQVWLNKKEINVTCDDGNHRARRGLVGGETSQNPNDSKYLQLAQESLQKYLSDHGDRQPHRIVRVERVTTQVVSGSLTKINFVATPTDNGNSFNCFSTIWEQVWLNKKDINVTCDDGNHRARRGLAGGETSQNPNDSKYLQLAQESLQKYLSDHGNRQPHRIVRVERVTTQVVSGSLTKINFVATPSDNGNSFNCFSTIWEQVWLNKKEINVTCDDGNHRARRGLVGGETSQNPNDSKYLQLAQESLQKYLSDHGNRQPHRIVRVERVTTQVVSGSLTRINFVATPSDNGNSFNCFSTIWEQVWLNKKEINVTCDDGNHRARRGLVGGETSQNPNDSKYLQLAQESLQKYLSDHGNRQPHRIVRVERVTTQVVSGSLTRINFVATPSDNGNSFNCFSTIWEQVWLNKKEINVTCDDGNHRARRGLVGGETSQNPNDSKYLQLAQESLQKYLSDHGNRQPHRIVRVERVTTQVVSGSLTRINFVATPSDNGNSFNCFSTIWEQVWLNKKEINVTCDDGNHRARRGLVGGETSQNPNDSKYLQLAQESLQKYLSDHGNRQPHRIVRVERVTTQVVSGSLTRINFVATPSDNGNSFNCFSTIWEQVWLNKKEINVTCDDGNHRARRGLVGGETSQNPNDSKYLQLAQESLQKYLSDHGNRQPHRIVRVERVTTQVVSGSLTRINFVATPSDNGNSFNCFSTIWEQVWLNKKEINVTCDIGNHRVRRQIPGGEILRNPDDPKYMQLAEDSLYKYLTFNGIQRPHAVVRIDKVTSQVVSGSLTTIYFVIAPTNRPNDDDKYCISKIWEQSWMNKNDIEVSCSKILVDITGDETELDQVETIGDETGQDKKETTTPETEQDQLETTGDQTEQDPRKPEYLQLAEESLQKYLSDCGNKKPHRVVRVDTVTTQVVVGLMTRINFVAMPTENSNNHIINCFSKIFEQSWLNNKEIDVTCDVGNHRVRRGIPGGETSQNSNDPKYLRLAEESLHKYLKDSNIQRPHSVMRIDHVITQVVAGLLTKIHFVATPTDNINSNSINCSSEIWEQSWINKKEIQVRCDNLNHRVRRQLINEELSLQDPNDPAYLDLGEDNLRRYVNDSRNKQYYKVGSNVSCSDNHRVSRQIDSDEAAFFQLAEDSLKKYLCDSGIQQPHKVVKVDNVTTQYDAGSITELDFVAVPSDNRNETTIICFSKIWEQIWLEIKEIDVTCDVVNNTVKKEEKVAPAAVECTSGMCTTDLPKAQKQPEVMEINDTKVKIKYENETTKPEYLFLAARALHKFSKKIGVLHKLNSVIHVATSSEYGMVYNIKFSASPTECFADVSITRALECRVVSNTTVFCDAIIREVPGLKRKIHVVCDTDDEDTDFDDYSDVENTHTATRAPSRFEKQDPQNAQKLKVQAIAEEALEQFLVTTTKKHLFRIVEILSFYEHLTDGMVSTVEFLVSPTICLRGDTRSVDRCPLKIPNIVYHCNAKMRERPILALRRDIKVGCKKLQTSKSKSFYRIKRRIDEENAVDNYIEVDYNDKFAANQVNDHQEGSTIDFYHRIQAENLFNEFLAKFNPSYADDKNELEHRFQIFKKNIKKIHELNIYEKGTATYGVTRFTDLTYEEFRSRYTGLKAKLRDDGSPPMDEAYVPPNATFPESFDWRELGAVTEVKDQGSCGSCWAFSVTGNIEGQLKIHSGQLVSLSEQELLDCDHKDLGCDGGIPENAYRSIEELGGLNAESDYPYKGKRSKCHYDNTSKKVTVNGAWNIDSNETNMAKWLVKNGPISVGINAQAMQFYKGGIAHPWKTNCSPSEVDHAVLIVGYGVKEYPQLKMKLPYWIVKNSWGKSWGEEGYYLVYRGDGTCGINTMPTSAKIVSS